MVQHGEHGVVVTARVAIIGAGPGGLMAAERLAQAGHMVTLFERMPTPARKFLMAGRGGLNLTHSEDIERFTGRYGSAAPHLGAALDAFSPQSLIAWANGLGVETFTGSSGRIFPKAMKASPLLRAWLRRLDALGVTLKLGHDWRGFATDGRLLFEVEGQLLSVRADAVILALGGASWPRLGSNGAWAPVLEHAGVAVTPLAAANCGIRVAWSDHLARFAGVALKRIALTLGERTMRGEAIITRGGLEGGAVYGLSGAIREALALGSLVQMELDHRPDMTLGEVAARLNRPRGKQSATTFLRKALALTPAQIALVREAGPMPADSTALASRIKAQPVTVAGLAGLERAISSAGGVAFDAVDEHLMLRACPGVFVAGEMLDWEAPTGGYLLQATFSTAVLAADGAARWIAAASSNVHATEAE